VEAGPVAKFAQRLQVTVDCVAMDSIGRRPRGAAGGWRDRSRGRCAAVDVELPSVGGLDDKLGVVHADHFLTRLGGGRENANAKCWGMS